MAMLTRYLQVGTTVGLTDAGTVSSATPDCAGCLAVARYPADCGGFCLDRDLVVAISSLAFCKPGKRYVPTYLAYYKWCITAVTALPTTGCLL